MKVWIRDVEPDHGGYVIYWQFDKYAFRKDGVCRTEIGHLGDLQASVCKEAKRLQVPVELAVTRVQSVSLTEASA